MQQEIEIWKARLESESTAVEILRLHLTPFPSKKVTNTFCN